MVSRSRFQPIAIALILRDDDGNIQIIGSKELDNSMVEATQDADSFPFVSTAYVRPRRSFHIEADCRSILRQQATPAPLPHAIEQRGIYLPDMSFRALPGPDEA